MNTTESTVAIMYYLQGPIFNQKLLHMQRNIKVYSILRGKGSQQKLTLKGSRCWV